ncbi:MAG: sigma 54-interacting transcriptional regulator [bacterium]
MVDCIRRAEAYPVRENCQEISLLSVLEHATSRQSLKQRLRQYEQAGNSTESFGTMLGKSSEMKDLFRLARILAERNDDLMIIGPSGSGKTTLARTIHEHSPRRFSPFFSFSCRSLSSYELSRELFGSVGSERNQKSTLLDMCDGGTLHLDHIGSISPHVQQQLYKYLAEESELPFAGQPVSRTDVRLIVSDEIALGEAVAKGEFLEGLYFSLSRFTMHLPPLHRRLEDIPVITRMILKRIAIENNLPDLHITEDALLRLKKYTWHQNVRELENVLEYSALVAGDGPIETRHLPRQFQDDIGTIFIGTSVDDLPPFSEVERRYILKVLEATRGNKLKAAEILDINRVTLHRKLQMYEEQEKNQ